MTENRAASFLQTISHVLVVGAGVLYLFGFIIVSIYDASYGIADFSLFRAKVIAVGCLFVLLLTLPVVVTFRSFKIFGLGRSAAIKTKLVRPENEPYLIADVATSFPFACAGIIAYPLRFLYVSPSEWGDRGFALYILVALAYVGGAIWGRDRFDKHPIRFLGISLILATAFFVVLFKYADRGFFWLVVWLSSVCFVTTAVWYWMRSPEEIRTTEWERLVLFLIPVIFGVYAVKLYPRIKPQYGGGAPVPIVLHITKKMPVFDSETFPVSLVDETEQGYYVLRGSDKAVFVARSLVEEVEFLHGKPVTDNNTEKHSAGLDRLSDIHDATRTCELATAISKKRPGRFEECISLPDVMVEDLENEFMNAFQKNPVCKSITVFVGTNDATKASAIEEQQKISQAKYRLHFHLTVTKEGDVNWRDSEWRLERATEGKSVSGKMDNLEKETTAFCGALLEGGGSVFYLWKN